MTLRQSIVRAIKELRDLYKADGYIDEDVKAHILYNDGSIISYPDQINQIKLRNIQNIHIMTADDSQDFNYDLIATSDHIGIAEACGWDYSWAKKQLILDDMDDYYKNYFNQ